jgi:hypothetical protein
MKRSSAFLDVGTSTTLLGVAVFESAGYIARVSSQSACNRDVRAFNRAPTLLINAKYDEAFPLETHARPLFKLLGSEHKRHYISEGAYLPLPFADGKAGYGGHFVPQAEVMAETFKWFDEYLGPVDRDAIVMNTHLR